ncbi:aminopeptidase [Salinirubellus salinus]|uniref:Aminopeptidase n=1 Tax=Salinirubellus salinus TaxID=1364945 RepID=A0A9E7U4W0_9EURY|nr:aminopeptidase [Salinirubellus salinus]UWM54750.1 aminopeptidase [Salinirubellus salinus]
MDERVSRHAEVLVEHCTGVERGDEVLIRAPSVAEDLVVALYERVGERGANATTWLRSPRAGRARARAMDADDFSTSEHRLAAMEATDVVILVQGARNRAAQCDVDPAKGSPASRARQPVLEARLDTRWVITQHPTAADAQAAERSTEAWRDTVYDAVDRDWAALRERQQRIADRLDATDEVRVSADGVDLTLDVSGMDAADDHATHNLPGGEVFTVPRLDGVDGEATFDVPVRRHGREVRNARLVFEDGRVVAHDAETGRAVLDELLATDEGASRVGELGFGTNRGITEATGRTLFDEKMGDTVHVALGDALPECVPEGVDTNESAVHVDLITDVGSGEVRFDGEVVQAGGAWWFEREA